jgi:hypothetical protein
MSYFQQSAQVQIDYIKNHEEKNKLFEKELVLEAIDVSKKKSVCQDERHQLIDTA